MEIIVDLWVWPLNGDPTGPLSPDEEARAARFVYPQHAAAFRTGRARLRGILAGYAGQAPADLVFAYNEQGKPALPDGPSFNLSHSGGWAALAVAEPGLRLGIDIEAWRPVEEGVARRFFSDAEQAALAGLSGDAWLGAFYRCWTRKEAFVKACGQGLSMPLDAFDVTLTPGNAAITRVGGGAPADWTLCDLAPGADIEGALAVEARGRPLRLRLREGQLPLPGHRPPP